MALERVVVLGAGLIGTSVALALRERGVRVWLDDADPATLRLAADLGAGAPLRADPPDRPADVALIAVPPAAVAAVLRSAQDRQLAHTYTDAASVKAGPLAEAAEHGCDLATFVPGHPMAGRELRGPGAARADLFLGRPWALCPAPKTDAAALAAVADLARACGAEPVVVDAEVHDRAVALVSHAPHVAAAAVAARLAEADDTALGLAGQGVRDVTRIAAGDPGLWTDILARNAAPVADVVEALAADLAALAAALRAADPEGLDALLRRGAAGRARIPGKHGGPAPAYALVPVVIPDEPNALARLFGAAGDAGVNIEDVRLEHSPGLPVGVAVLHVRPEAAGRLGAALRDGGWSVHA
ncbi:prephenate dehydrogenase [Allonocardiopsis opalescens]|uniref:Prephenate dehydrogenase n=1 Tax=Allonocardiopsis opalescens TaxID=1144618 RepID=A0A2T0Q4B8_9ACTN|nr:prephenate dehydrogenase [Allonocardiopsis opalescens]PRX98655.1 prephenate dehydrogenase [Allonocardiopsis opalescens]